MKLAKKVLSVVLAVVLALGAFAVAGSANGNPDTAEYQVKMWLTGTKGTVEWTANSKVSFEETGEESAPGAEIEVQPGDTIFVHFYCTNNYYVQLIQANVFYSTDLLNAADVYMAQRGRAITAANLKKIQFWNEAHYWVELQGMSYSNQNVWDLQNPDFNVDVAQNWPTDDAGNNLFNIDEWKFHRFNNLASENSGETCIFDDEENYLFVMPVTIPDSAQAGDTFYVTIPEGTEQRSEKPYGALRLPEIGIADGEEEPSDIVDGTAATTPNMTYADENQYFDLSEATLTLKVPGASQPEVDYTELNAKMTEAADLLAAGNLTQASVDALNAAIEAGNAALESTDQTVVDTAVETLAAAIAAAEGLADYSELTKAIARYEALNPADWSNFATATEKYDDAKAIEEGLGVSAQGTIDAAAAALNDAIDNLVAALDYSALEATYNSLVNKDVANYTDETVARFNAALARAKALLDNKNAADQAEINAADDELVAANGALALKAASYDALNAAIAKYDDLDAKAWTSASYALATEKYEAAKAIQPGLDITAQDTIDAAAQALEAAITALVPATGANYNDLDAAIAEFEALVEENYTTDSYAAAKTAYNAAKAVARDLTSEQQATIDNAATALTTALGNLVEADADYSAVNTAKAAAAAKVAENDEGTLRYTDASIKAINDAVDAVVEGLKKKDQATVDGYAAAINEAIANAEYRPYDYTAINDHIAAIEANDADYYDADSYAAYLAAKEALVWNYTHKDFAAAKLQQIKFLKVNPTAAAAADYSAVEDAIAAYEAKKAAANYTEESIAAVDAEIAKVVYGLNANHQNEVDAYAEAINAAIEKMEEVVVEYADYSRIEAALATIAGLNKAEYTTATWAAIDEALELVEGLAKDLLKTQQSEVDAVADALEAAIAGLKKLANREALEAAILRAGTYDKNVWTADSWAAVEAALAAAEKIDADLSVDDQQIIDDAAEAINKALDDLKAKEVVSSISTINWTPSEDTHNTFTVAVTGRMSMIQFIEMDGGTRTYDRYNKNVTIVSYNAAGEVVNSLSRDVAYEVWTIYTNLIGPDVRARAKYLEGTSYKWETETYDFTVETLEPVFDAEIRSITPAATAGKKGAVATTVVVGPDAQGIRFVMDNGTTTTYYAEKATVLENGDLQFTGNAWANNDGLNTIIVKVRVNNAWVEAGTVEYTVE